MRLVVDDDDVLLAGEIAAHPPDDLIGRFNEGARLAAGQDRLGQPRRVAAFVREEGVIVGDQDARLAEPLEQVRRQHVALAIVVVRVARQEDAQTIPNGDARRHDQERVREARILAILELVQRLPGNQHRHDDCLAGAGRHLEREAPQAGIRRVVRGPEIVLDPGVAVLPRHLGDVYRGLDRFDLAEEQQLVAILAGPVGQQPRRRPRHADVAALAPGADPLMDAIDDRIGLDPVLGPFRFELELLALLLRARDRNEM